MNDLGERDIRKEELDKSRGDSRKFPVQLVKSMESGIGMGCAFSISRVINVLSRSRGQVQVISESYLWKENRFSLLYR